MIELKEGDIIYYIGSYDRCHGFKYKITKVYHGGYYDIELVDQNDWQKGAYTVIWSVNTSELKKIEE